MKTTPVGRLALRVEGTWWVAYFATQGTMEGAVTLGKLRMAIAVRPERKAAFMALMQEAVADLIEDRTGERPTYPDAPVTAPEHERSGNA